MQDRTIALAGIFQAARLVQQLSREGRADPNAFQVSARSVLLIDAESVAAVYGGITGVALGLDLIKQKLGGDATPQDIEIAKYAVAVIQLQSSLARHGDIEETIQNGIRTIRSQMEFFEAHPDSNVQTRLVEKLADLYTRTLSTLTPRIMVTGEQGFLANTYIAASVRAALFAGIRSAALWRQLGGRRWQLLIHRRKFAEEAARILAERR